MSFTWKPFFNELFIKVANDYNANSLAEVLYKIFPENGMMDKVKGKSVRFKEIDPLVFLARFNRGEKHDKRKEFCKNAKQELKLMSEVPEDFDGIPTFDNRNFWFSPWTDDRKGFELKILWKLAKELANNGQVTEETFNSSLKSAGTGPVSLSDVCYIVWPEKFLPLDRRTKGYLEAVVNGLPEDFDNIKKSENPYKTYSGIVELVKKSFPDRDFAQISYDAYLASEKAYWVAGAYWQDKGKASVDKTPEFIEKGVWLNGFDVNSRDPSLEEVKNVKVGDCIAIKSSATKGSDHKTPFIKIKAIGIVEENKGDGVELKVNWIITDEPFDVDGVSYRKTFEKVREKDEDLIFGALADHEELGKLSVDFFRKIIPKVNGKQLKFLTELAKFGTASANANQMAEKCGYTSYVEANSTIGAIGGIIRNALSEEKIKIQEGDFNNYELVGPWVNNGWRMHRNLRIALEGQIMKSSKILSAEVLKKSKNIIFYGPPGTGKTRQLLELQKYFTDNEITDKTDAILKWIQDESVTWWDVIAAALIDINEPVEVPVLLKHRFIQTKLKFNPHRSPQNSIWGILQRHTVHESTTVRVKDRQEPLVVNKDNNSKWFLTADWKVELSDLIELVKDFSTTKPAKAEEKRFEMITFHQSYSYEEFVEGIRPHLEPGAAGVSYKVKDGVFKKICQRALENPSKEYAIFIDEINRGNISKIFGELITLIEEDKRIGGKYGISDLKLPYSDSVFGVPQNLFVIGTMNSVDRSIALVDMALRRRFSFQAIGPDANLVPIDVSGVKFRKIFEKLNDNVSIILGNEYKIGHSYFTDEKANSIEKLQDIWFCNLLPLIQEYLFDDWEKIKVLVKNFVEIGEDINDLKELSLPRYCKAGFVSPTLSKEEFIKRMKELE